MSAVASGYVGILTFELHFPGESSLKGKRKHLLALKSHLQQRAGRRSPRSITMTCGSARGSP